MNQASLFDAPPSMPAEESHRLNGQCMAIIERLRTGRATNDELSRISRKYTSRISDCRKAGYTIECVAHDHKTGVTVYELKREPSSQRYGLPDAA